MNGTSEFAAALPSTSTTAGLPAFGGSDELNAQLTALLQQTLATSLASANPFGSLLGTPFNPFFNASSFPMPLSQDVSKMPPMALMDWQQQAALIAAALNVPTSSPLLFPTSMANASLASTLASFQPSLNGIPSSLSSSLPSSLGIPSATLEQLALSGALMRPRVNSAASSSTSSSNLSSPIPVSSPDRRRKRARSMLVKPEALLKDTVNGKVAKKVDTLVEAIENEDIRRQEAARGLAAMASSNGHAAPSAPSPLQKAEESIDSKIAMLPDVSKITLRPLIDESQLPETVDEDSPFRHHPKYQKKRDESTDFLGQSMLSALAINKDSPKGENKPSDEKKAPEEEDPRAAAARAAFAAVGKDPSALSALFDKFMDDVIQRELVATN